MKRAGIGIALGLVLASLAGTGCRGREELPEGVVQIEFWHAMAGPLGPPLKKLIEAFERENPDVRVRSVFQAGYAQLSQKINLALASDDPPDIAQMYEATVAFCNRTEELIEPLDGYMARDAASLDWQDVFPAFRETARIGDRTYSLPVIKSFPVLYYNKDIFREAGLLEPPRTWEEFAAVGRQLTVDRDQDGTPDRWGWAFVTDAWIFECQVLQNGGRFLNPDGTSALGGAPALEAVRFLVEATQGEGRYAYRSTGYDHQLDFADERVAMVLSSTVSRTFMRDQIRFDVGIAPIPQGPRKASIMSGAGLSIFAGRPTANKEAAWRFLEFMARANSTLYWGIATNYIPIRQSATRSEDYRRRLEADPGFGAGVAQLEYATSEPPLPSWYQCRQILNNSIERVLNEPSRAEQVFQEGIREMDRVLADERAHEAEMKRKEPQ